MTTIAQSTYASVAHRYWRPEWSAEKNREIYMEDATSEGLGANMLLELEADRALLTEDEVKGLLTVLKERLDHQCLFLNESRFATEPSTLENITVDLTKRLDREGWRSLTVWESPRLGCRVNPQGEMVLIFKRRNLTLEIAGVIEPLSGIAVRRKSVENSVEGLLVKLNSINDPDIQSWGTKLFSALQVSLPGLISVRVDLGRHDGIVVHSGT